MQALRSRGVVAVLAALALAVAIVGPADAARMITGKQIKNSSITGQDVKNGSIKTSDLAKSARAEEGPEGPAGPSGPAGPAGPAGANGVVGPIQEIQGNTVTLGTGGGTSVGSSKAECPAGTAPISGGASFPPNSDSAPTNITYGTNSRSGNGWSIIAINHSSQPATFYTVAYCVQGGTSARQAMTKKADPRAAALRRAVGASK